MTVTTHDSLCILSQVIEEEKQQKALLAAKNDAEKQQAEFNEEERRAKANVEKKCREEAEEAERVARYEIQLQEAEGAIKSREEKKAKREAIRAARVDLVSEKKNLEASLASTKEGIETAKRSILKSESGLAAVEALQQENNAIEAEQILPGQIDYEAACKERDTYKKLIKDEQERTDVSDARSELEAAKKEAAISNEEHEKILSDLAEKQAELEELKRVSEEHNIAHDKEMEEIEKTIEELSEKCATGSRRVEEAKLRLGQVEDAKAARVELVHKL